MAGLIFVTLFIVVAAISPFLGRDTSGDTYVEHPDERAWWPGGPNASPRPRY